MQRHLEELLKEVSIIVSKHASREWVWWRFVTTLVSYSGTSLNWSNYQHAEEPKQACGKTSRAVLKIEASAVLGIQNQVTSNALPMSEDLV